MTGEQEAFLDILISDLKKLKNEKSQENIFSYFRLKYDILLGEEELNFIKDQMVEWKGFKDIFEWHDSIDNELFERSQTCFQDILALQELYQKEQKNEQGQCIRYLLDILADIKNNQWIFEEIERTDSNFRELLLDCCSLKLMAIREMMYIINSKRKEDEEVKGGFLPIAALHYWMYDHLQLEIEIFLDDHVFHTRKQKLFPSRDESYFKSDPKGINEYYSDKELKKKLSGKNKKEVVYEIAMKNDISVKKAFKLVKDKAEELGIGFYAHIDSFHNS